MVELASPPDPKIRRARLRLRRSTIVWAAGLLLLAIVAPPFINIGHFRRSIVRSISAGLGRPVHASAVELTLFPRPAFILHKLTVSEDAEYGAEPMLMADTVTASLRASTLWHRRVEIATLHFDAPSLNLARNAQGHWNFESLLRHSPALRSASAPGKPAGTPPPFPYVEATDARINFKQGPEKLPFSLEGADLALWKESGRTWHMRIKARPVRTDLTVADSGQIRGEGMLQISSELENSPIHFTLEWRQVQLGEISRLLHGEDEGWRGTVDWTTQARGTVANALLTTDIQLDEFRRAEFIPPSEMDMSAHCRGHYLHARASLDSLQCTVPLGTGQLLVHGRGPLQVWSAAALSPAEPDADRASPVQIGLHHVPAELFLDLYRHLHPGVAGDAAASGEINGETNCDWRGPGHLRASLETCTGEIRSTAIGLNLPHDSRSLRLSPLLLISSRPSLQHAPSLPAIGTAVQQQVPGKPSSASSSAAWSLGPSHVSLGSETPATLTGVLTPKGVRLNITGSADLTELFGLAQALRMPALSREIRSIRGNAQLALSLHTIWLPQSADVDLSGRQFSPSHWAGVLQLHDVTVDLASLPGSVQLTSGVVNIMPESAENPGSIEWTNLEGTYARTSFDGAIRWQTACALSPATCARSFALHTSNLNAGLLPTALRHGNASSGLLDLVNPWAGNLAPIPEISGTVSADTLSAGRISVKNAVLDLIIQGQSAKLLAISGNIFGGTIQGSPGTGSTETVHAAAQGVVPDPTAKKANAPIGSAQWSNGALTYTLRVTLQHIQPDKVAAIWHEHWGRGLASAQIDIRTQGWSATELAQHATGDFSIDWLNGAFGIPPRTATALVSKSAPRPEKFLLWTAQGRVHNETLLLSSGKFVGLDGIRPQQLLDSRRPHNPSIQSVTGTVTFARTLDLRLRPSGISITGPLTMPIVKARPHATNAPTTAKSVP